MTSDEKVKWVRDKIYEQEKLSGLGVISYRFYTIEQEVPEYDDFLALLGNPDAFGDKPKKPKQSVVVLTIDEQKNILKGLEKDGLIKITELNDKNAMLEVFPLHPSPIKLKTLEHIARKLGDTYTGTQIVDTLLDYGIPRADIPYPNTKWRTLQDMFVALATSPSVEQHAKFGGAITAFLHPLNFGADEAKSQELISDFNKYLKYDGYEITVADDEDGYKLTATSDRRKVAKPLTDDEKRQERIDAATPAPSRKIPAVHAGFVAELQEQVAEREREDEYSERVEYETKILQQPQAAEHLAVIREAYKTLMAIVSSFCTDPATPSRELNAAYTELSKVVVKELNDFCGDFSEFEVFSFDQYKQNNFGVPFGTLYVAELEFKKAGRRLHWDEIRPEMNAVLGQIEELCQTAGSPDVIAEPKVQKIIGDAMLLLSEIATKRKGASTTKSEPTMKLEITKMPEVQVRNADESTITKGKKRIRLPKFSSTDWAKITWRFVDERNVVINADKKEQVLADFESLGFADDKRGKPNSAWAFLLALSRNYGETQPLTTPIPDSIKQHKKQVSDRLKAIFKNESDPFEDPAESRTYKIKIALIAPDAESTKSDKLGVREYLAETMTEEYEE